jgi:hypothetical protein
MGFTLGFLIGGFFGTLLTLGFLIGGFAMHEKWAAIDRRRTSYRVYAKTKRAVDCVSDPLQLVDYRKEEALVN